MATEDDYDDAIPDDAIDEARAAMAEAIAKAKTEVGHWAKHALSLIEKCYGDAEAAREIWNDAFEEAVRITREAGVHERGHRRTRQSPRAVSWPIAPVVR
jgi:hypothetical protein